MTLPDRIAQKIEKTDSCWIWKGARNQTNYGRVLVAGKNRYAHRIIWELANGKIPDDMNVLHKCDNPSCVNPDHLFLGTDSDNMYDMYNKGRHSDHKGTNNSNHKLSESDVINIRILDIPQKNIARLYEIHPATVDRIKRKIHWKHLP